MNKTKVVNVRFSEEEVNMLKEIAERENRSLSSLVRLLSLKNLELKKENVIDMEKLTKKITKEIIERDLDILQDYADNATHNHSCYMHAMGANGKNYQLYDFIQDFIDENVKCYLGANDIDVDNIDFYLVKKMITEKTIELYDKKEC